MVTPAQQRFAGIDIGGTKIYALVTDGNGKILGSGRKKSKADQGYERVLDRVAQCLEEACTDAKVAMKDLLAVGVGAPSPISANGTAIYAPNLKWQNKPLARNLKSRFGVPVFAENDCNAGTLGEYALGGGQGARNLAGLFVGTGLGGGLVLNGEVVSGTNRMAAEIGHMVILPGGRKCGCGHRGCLEAYASKAGMGKKFIEEIIVNGRDSMLEKECGRDLFNVRSGILKKAWLAKDPVAVETLREAATYLGYAAGNMISLLGPDKIVIGGGVFEALGRNLLPLVRRSAKTIAFPERSFKDTKIVLATLGDDAVALGAMVHARQSLS